MTQLAIVTGDADFIGSHVVDTLIERSDHVIVLDDFSTGKRSNLEQHLGMPRLRRRRAR